jgi:hypothetical protein
MPLTSGGHMDGLIVMMTPTLALSGQSHCSANSDRGGRVRQRPGAHARRAALRGTATSLRTRHGYRRSRTSSTSRSPAFSVPQAARHFLDTNDRHLQEIVRDVVEDAKRARDVVERMDLLRRVRPSARPLI